MSAETRAALEDAIAAHIRDENDGAILTGFVAIACGVSAQDERPATRYSFCDGGVPWHQTAGLLKYATAHHDDELAMSWAEEDEDET